MTERTTPLSDELDVRTDGPVRFLTLNRPQRRNALSRSLVTALWQAIETANADDGVRVIVLAGAGPTFCAGGDISQYASAPDSTIAREDGAALIGLLHAMTTSRLPIVARAHGGIFGGGVGLLSASDIVVAADRATFSLSEARLGIIPAVISPYVVAAIGAREARARMLRAAPFDAGTALRIGLAHECVPEAELDAGVDRVLADLLRCAPGALRAAKHLPAMLAATAPELLSETTADLFAERTTSDEGREGLRAFLEKRPAAWVEEWQRS